jgi:rare lipoprotein A
VKRSATPAERRLWPPLLLMCVALAACSSGKVRDGAPSRSTAVTDLPGDAVPRPEPRSRYGNGPVYEVLGQRYEVMRSSKDYVERGVASWYGTKFHGRLTSSREPYDMYAMTAAHKTLPLPTYVRVRNLGNGKSVVVRVNDRGPFVSNRIIDLSYAAALRLDMVAEGTSLVEVSAISFDDMARTAAAQPDLPPPAATSGAGPGEPFVQVGAFGDRANAERRRRMLQDNGIENAFIHTDTDVTPALYRVRIGPVHEVVQFDSLIAQLEDLGITDPYLIAD